jgi:hypothetical protein
MKLTHINVLSMAMALTGCATVPPLNTPSGQPELTIRGKSMDEVQAALVQMCQAENMNLEDTQKYMVSCSYPSNDFGLELVLGSSYNNKPQVLIRFNTIPQPDKSIRMTAKGIASSTSTMGGKQQIDLSGVHLQRMQGYLAEAETIMGVK